MEIERKYLVKEVPSDLADYKKWDGEVDSVINKGQLIGISQHHRNNDHIGYYRRKRT